MSPTPLDLIRQTLAEAEAGLARAIEGRNATAEANIISRLHTIRTDYAAILATLADDAEDPTTPDEALEAISVLLPVLDDDGRRVVLEALGAVPSTAPTGRKPRRTE